MNNRVIIVAISAAIVTICATAMLLFVMHPKPHAMDRRMDVRVGLRALQYEAIEEAIELSEEQIAPFKALYDEYTAAAAAQRPMSRRTDSVKMSDEQIEAMIIESFGQSRRAISLKERYYRRFREILTPTQISIMYEVERQTREKFANELERRSNNIKNNSGNKRGTRANEREKR
ncbi:MAG: hypothetical protein SNH79_02665 [Rikenellaceae bacterium]